MTSLSLLLLRNGLPDLPVVLIEPHRNRGGIWRINFSYDTGLPLSMSTKQASSVAVVEVNGALKFHRMPEADLDRFFTEVE